LLDNPETAPDVFNPRWQILVLALQCIVIGAFNGILDIGNGVVTDTRIVQNSIPDNQPDRKLANAEFFRRKK